MSPHQLKHTILRGSRAAWYLFHALVASMAYPKLIYDPEHGKKRSGYRDFGNRPSLELLATEIDSRPRKIVCFNLCVDGRCASPISSPEMREH